MLFYYCSYESKLVLRKFILLLLFSRHTPLHLSVSNGHLEVCRLLVKSKADVATRGRCFSPHPSRHFSLTICLAAVAKLHSKSLSTTSKPTLLHTCAALARLNDAPPDTVQIKAVLVGHHREQHICAAFGAPQRRCAPAPSMPPCLLRASCHQIKQFFFLSLLQ